MKRWLKHHKWQLILATLPLILLAIVAYQNQKRPQHLLGLGGAVTAIAYAPQGDTIVCASDNAYIQVWKPDIKKWRSFREGQNSRMGGASSLAFLHFSGDGQALYGAHLPTPPGFGGVENTLQKWNLDSRRQEQVFRAVPNSAFAISPDEHWAATSSISGRFTLDMLDLTREHKVDSKYPLPPNHLYFFLHQQTPVSQPITALAFAPTGPLLAAWDGATDVTLHDVPNAKAQRALALTHPPSAAGQLLPAPVPAALAWSPDGQWLAAYNGARLQIWDIESGQTQSATVPKAAITPGMGGKMPTLAWSRDGHQIATGGDSVGLWSAPNLKLQRQLRAQGGVAFAPDGRTLATGGFEGAHEVLLWPLKNWPF